MQCILKYCKIRFLVGVFTIKFILTDGKIFRIYLWVICHVSFCLENLLYLKKIYWFGIVRVHYATNFIEMCIWLTQYPTYQSKFTYMWFLWLLYCVMGSLTFHQSFNHFDIIFTWIWHGPLEAVLLNLVSFFFKIFFGLKFLVVACISQKSFSPRTCNNSLHLISASSSKYNFIAYSMS